MEAQAINLIEAIDRGNTGQVGAAPRGGMRA